MDLTSKKRSRRIILPLILMMTVLMLFTGCQKKQTTSQQPVQTETEQAETTAAEKLRAASEEDTSEEDKNQDAALTGVSTDVAEQKTNVDTVATQAAAGAITETQAGAETTTEPAAGAITETQAAAGATTEPIAEASTDPTPPSIAEDGTYTTKDDVALYTHTYGKLPENFITKKAAKKLGWQGGSLEDYAPGKCIGGDYFGNYEGLLPEDKEYHECDIDTLGKSKRGAKRIIYSDDGYIYYTDDHYESFELLYEP